MGIGKILTAPFRGVGWVGENIWDVLTVDDEERAKKEAKRQERYANNPERYGPTSGESTDELSRRAQRRWSILRKAEEMGIPPGVAIDAEMLREARNSNRMAGIQLANDFIAADDLKRERGYAALLEYLQAQRARRDAMQNSNQSASDGYAQVRMPGGY